MTRTNSAKQRLQPITDPNLLADAKQCLTCTRHYAPASFIKRFRNQEHRELLADICARCYLKAQEKISGHNAIARDNGGKTGLQASEWLVKLVASQGHCFYCEEHFGYAQLVIEHVVPLTSGGNNTIENVVPACKGCNSAKGSRNLEDWGKYRETYHLQQRLLKHFNLSKTELINLALKRLAIQEGLLIDGNEATL